MNKTTFFIVRHGQSEGNVEAIKTQEDPQLTEKGRDQARKRAKDLQTIHFDQAYSSLLRRAVQTTQLLIENRSIPYQTYEDLKEREYGDFFARPEFPRIIDEIVVATNQMSGEEWWNYQHSEASEIETYTECFQRFYARLQSLAKVHQDQTILLVSHGDLMRALLIFSQFGNHKELQWDAVENTGYIVLEMEGDKQPSILTTVDIKKV